MIPVDPWDPIRLTVLNTHCASLLTSQERQHIGFKEVGSYIEGRSAIIHSYMKSPAVECAFLCIKRTWEEPEAQGNRKKVRNNVHWTGCICINAFDLNKYMLKLTVTDCSKAFLFSLAIRSTKAPSQHEISGAVSTVKQDYKNKRRKSNFHFHMGKYSGDIYKKNI